MIHKFKLHIQVEEFMNKIVVTKRKYVLNLLLGNNHTVDAMDYYCDACKITFGGIKQMIIHWVLFCHKDMKIYLDYNYQRVIDNINIYALKRIQFEI